MNPENNQIVDNLMDAQKGMVDSMVENTKKMTAGNTMVSETIEKGSEWYKNWLDTQKSFFGKTTEKMTEAGETIKENAEKAKDSYQSMMDRQTNMMRQMYDMNVNFMKQAMPANGAAGMPTGNPMEAFTGMWSNAMNTFQNSMNNGNVFNNWMKSFQGMNPLMNGAMNAASGNGFTNMFGQWNELLGQQMNNFQNNFKSGNAQDAFRNMMNTADGYNRFYQLWAPMWKSVQDKSFNTEMFRKMMNPGQYKEMLDQYFGFMPEQMRSYMQQSSGMMQDMMKQWSAASTNGMEQMRGMMGQFTPAGTDLFGGALSGYNNFYNNLQSAFAPMARMSTPNKYTKSMTEWNDIANRMVQFNIKNAELQYMVYEQGQQVMEELSRTLTQKLQNGEEITSMMALYQEWMNLSDKTFVKLFESEAYSALMAEVSSMQMRLKKDMELQMESALTNVPVATRSELDELYKTIYDLKKQVRQLEKMMEVEGDNDNIADAPATNNNSNNTNNKPKMNPNGAPKKA
ncbi:MAG: hypothetical protein EOP52_08045 [Sphingobacteriales bacterium]|nr:MAG: hypothetical protein EOP52_08045 [Sphingobacteriales bacterium]